MAASVSKMMAIMVLLCMISTAPYEASATVTCSQVASAVSSCINFAKGPGGTPPAPCCNGIRAMWNAAATTPDRQTTCRCLKAVASNIPNVNMGTVATLPAKCGVNIPYKFSLSTNCDTVK